ncbi:MAG: acyl carrier protein [Bacteroidetes bacterium]|jgi:acyl carrier protein|nr:acyl carrier protein [Bacteroidota bacterium]
MDIKDFINKIETEIDEFEEGSLKPETNLRNTSAWTSMHALILIALIDTEYNVTITGEDLRTITSIEDLYNIVKERTRQ